MDEQNFSISRDGTAVRGVIDRPINAAGAVPTMLVVAGSGPTDRDGNAPGGLHTDAYKDLAAALSARGIATVRYDKRGVGASDKTPESALTLWTFVEDARAFVDRLRADARVSSVFLLGHSEGGVIALELAQTTPIDGLILVATPGRTLAAVLRAQLALQLDNATLKEVDRLMADVRAGSPLANIPVRLEVLFRPSVSPYLRSMLDVDPAALLASVHDRTLIVQGDMDIQVSVDDAKRLAAAAPAALLVVAAGMAHTLKVESARIMQQRSYFDPGVPLSPPFVDAVTSFVRSTNEP
jgi:pimeloyl-ACP methyl ester carboxylesterase